MAENDSSAPVIQRTTRPIEKGGNVLLSLIFAKTGDL